MTTPLVSIITPSFKASAWLKLCIASVADQGVTLEHIVQDSCSNDGTQDWLPGDPRVKAFIEKDSGMYDAVNRGLRRASGEILGYLNCDEQYLPGALRAVVDYFEQHPDVDVLFGDCIVVDANGDFLCYRKVTMPWKYHVMIANLPTFTCSTFFRRRVLEKGFFFDTRWRDVGDADWALRLIDAKARMGVLHRYLSAFADTGENMNLAPNAQREKREIFASAPWWARSFSFGLVAHHRLCRFLEGNYSQAPFDYSIYTRQSPGQRVTRHVDKPTFLWKNRMSVPAYLGVARR